ncbi:MAG TPA: nuclear transport factor 2 family protein [Thermoanaerobaculia bacterium]|jgi:hypothetical protein
MPIVKILIFLLATFAASAEERKLTSGTLLLPAKTPAPAVILMAPNARELAPPLLERGIAVLIANENADVLAAAREVVWQREIRSREIGLFGPAAARETASKARRSIAFVIPETDEAKIGEIVLKRLEAPGRKSAELEAFNRAMEATLRRGDLAGVAKFYAPEGEVRGPGVVIHGREAITGYWTSVKDATDWKLEVLDTGGSKDQPWQRGRSILRTPERDHIAEFVLLFERNANGKLEIVLDFYY